MTDSDDGTCCFLFEMQTGQRMLGCFAIFNAFLEIILLVTSFGDMGRQKWLYVMTTITSIHLAVRYAIWIKHES